MSKVKLPEQALEVQGIICSLLPGHSRLPSHRRVLVLLPSSQDLLQLVHCDHVIHSPLTTKKSHFNEAI